MKKVVFSLLLVISTTVATAQAPVSVGQFQLNLGLGLSNHGIPIAAGLDYGLFEDVTVGGEISYRNRSYTTLGIKHNSTVTGFSANANYHFNTLLSIPSPWNFYAGLNVGFYVWSHDENFKNNNNSGLGLGLQIGGRYYFTDKLGVLLEFGGGNVLSGGKIGISIRL
jgi:outer membrane immunogenic protein